jgi:GxxExxY protein
MAHHAKRASALWHKPRMGHGVPDRASAEALNQITSTIIAAAIRVHRTLGPGLLEHAYVACLAYELTTNAVRFEIQKSIPLVYRAVKLDCVYRVDMVVEGSVIVEVKAMDAIAHVHVRQLHTYVRLADCPVGLLLNFGAPTMKAGIKRVVNGFPENAASV